MYVCVYIYIYVCICTLCLVTQSCLTLWDPMNCSPPAPLSTRILQARILEWVAMPSSRGSFWPWDQTQVSLIAGGFFTIWNTREVQEYWSGLPFPSPGDLPYPGIKPRSPALQADSSPAELPGKPMYMNTHIQIYTFLDFFSLHIYMKNSIW